MRVSQNRPPRRAYPAYSEITIALWCHESLLLAKRPWYLLLRGKLFIALSRNALRAADQFEIPPNRVIELGTQIEI